MSKTASPSPARRSTRDAPTAVLTVQMRIRHIRVTDYSEESDHTLYHVRCDAMGMRFKMKQRFKAFLALHEVVAPALGLPSSFPVAKTVFHNEEMKKARMKQLQDYLNVVASLCDSSPPRAFVEFLGIDPEQTKASPGLDKSEGCVDCPAVAAEINARFDATGNAVQTFDCKAAAEKIKTFDYKGSADKSIEYVKNYDYKGTAEAAIEQVKVATPRAIDAVKTFDYKGVATGAVEGTKEAAEKATESLKEVAEKTKVAAEKAAAEAKAAAEKAAAEAGPALDKAKEQVRPAALSRARALTCAHAPPRLSPPQVIASVEAAKTFDYKGTAETAVTTLKTYDYQGKFDEVRLSVSESAAVAYKRLEEEEDKIEGFSIAKQRLGKVGCLMAKMAGCCAFFWCVLSTFSFVFALAFVADLAPLPPLPPAFPTGFAPPPSPPPPPSPTPLSPPPPPPPPPPPFPPMTWSKVTDVAIRAREFLPRQTVSSLDRTKCKATCMAYPECHGVLLEPLAGGVLSCHFYDEPAYDLYRAAQTGQNNDQTLLILWPAA